MAEPEQLVILLREGGEGALNELIARRESEALYLDFKQSGDAGAGRLLNDSDKANLSKAISGFGNSAGGVVVWGADCRPHDNRGDVVHEKVPIANVARFKSLLESAVAGATLPSHNRVEHFVFGEQTDGSGYVVTLVPPADNAPLQVPRKWLYYMRVGSSFEPIPHPVLAAMFGRRPSPQLAVEIANASLKVIDKLVQATVSLYVSNEGHGIARDLFLNVELGSLPCDAVPATVTPMQDSRMMGINVSRNGYSMIARTDSRFPPGSRVGALFVTVGLVPAVVRELSITISAGCENGPPSYRTLSQNKNKVAHSYDLALKSTADPMWIAGRVFGIAREMPEEIAR